VDPKLFVSNPDPAFLKVSYWDPDLLADSDLAVWYLFT
jgi:hypothetical protein